MVAMEKVSAGRELHRLLGEMAQNSIMRLAYPGSWLAGICAPRMMGERWPAAKGIGAGRQKKATQLIADGGGGRENMDASTYGFVHLSSTSNKKTSRIGEGLASML